MLLVWLLLLLVHDNLLTRRGRLVQSRSVMLKPLLLLLLALLHAVPVLIDAPERLLGTVAGSGWQDRYITEVHGCWCQQLVIVLSLPFHAACTAGCVPLVKCAHLKLANGRGQSCRGTALVAPLKGRKDSVASILNLVQRRGLQRG